MLLHVNVVQVRNLPQPDKGACSSYVVAQLGDQKFKSRVVEGSAHPLIRQAFHFQVDTFASDKLELKVYDKNDAICDLEVLVKDLGPGSLTDRWFPLRPIRKSNAEVRLVLHLANASDTPFVVTPFEMYSANIRIIEFRAEKKADYVCAVQVNGQEEKMTKRVRDARRAIFGDEFSLVVANPATDVITIRVLAGKVSVGQVQVPVSSYEVGTVCKEWFRLDGGRLRVALHIAPASVPPFESDERSWNRSPG